MVLSIQSGSITPPPVKEEVGRGCFVKPHPNPPLNQERELI